MRITKSAYYSSHHFTNVLCTVFYYDQNPFFNTLENENPELLQKWGKVCNVADLPRGRCAMKGERSTMLQTFPLGGRSAMLQIFRGKVCNVADLPGGRSAMLQTFRGEVCNVADLPGGRSARGKVGNTTPGPSAYEANALSFKLFLPINIDYLKVSAFFLSVLLKVI